MRMTDLIAPVLALFVVCFAGCGSGGGGRGDGEDDTESETPADTTGDDVPADEGDEPDPAPDAADDPDLPDDPDVPDEADATDLAEEDGVDAEPDADPDLCPDGFPRGDGTLALTEVARFTPAPEGVTVCPGGDVFVSLFSASEIWRIPEDGSPPELWTTLAGRGPSGLACDDAGRIYVADFGLDGSGIDPACVRVDHAGHAGLVLPSTVGSESLVDPNGIVFVPGRGVYMSDSSRGWIVRYVEESTDVYAASLVASGPDLEGFLGLTGANGLSWEASTDSLVVAVSTLPRLQAWSVAPDGTLGASPTELWSSANITLALDGSAVDENGETYAARYMAGEVVRTSDGASLATITNPASMAMRGGTLLVTSYVMGAGAEGSLQALDLGACTGAL